MTDKKNRDAPPNRPVDLKVDSSILLPPIPSGAKDGKEWEYTEEHNLCESFSVDQLKELVQRSEK